MDDHPQLPEEAPSTTQFDDMDINSLYWQSFAVFRKVGCRIGVRVTSRAEFLRNREICKNYNRRQRTLKMLHVPRVTAVKRKFLFPMSVRDKLFVQRHRDRTFDLRDRPYFRPTRTFFS